MKKLKKFEIGILGGIPLFYIVAYFAFLWATKPTPTSLAPFGVAPSMPNTRTIVTGKIPYGKYGPTLFKPAINAHMKLTGDMFYIRVHELS